MSPNSLAADGVVPRVSSKFRRRRPCFFALFRRFVSVAEVLEAIFHLKVQGTTKLEPTGQWRVL